MGEVSFTNDFNSITRGVKMTKNIKPFNLEAALAGEPVMLRNGKKAYVRHHETELSAECGWQLIGFIVRYGKESALVSWDIRGRFHGAEIDYENDIIGMWPKTRIVNGFEVPAPETEEPKNGDWFFKADIYSEEFYNEEDWRGCSYDLRGLQRGLLFLNKEDAIANTKAMLGINPYNE